MNLDEESVSSLPGDEGVVWESRGAMARNASARRHAVERRSSILTHPTNLNYLTYLT
jgi:hypothetical protein